MFRSPIPRVETVIKVSAGLLTDSSVSVPSRCAYTISGKEEYRNITGATQQRDCPGFTPDSLLIPRTETLEENQYAGENNTIIQNNK